MPTATLQATQSCLIKSSDPSTNFSTGASEQITDSYGGSGLLISFEAVPQALRTKRITAIDIYCYIYAGKNESAVATAVWSPFSESTATYSNTDVSAYVFNGEFVNPGGYSKIKLGDYDVEHFEKVLKSGVAVFTYGYQGASIDTTRGANKPYAVIHYEDDVMWLGNATPWSGYVPKNKANAFSWLLSSSGYTYDAITQTSAVFRWRTSDTATPTEIALTTAQNVTIPANTFTTAEVQWQVTAVSSTGVTKTSDWYTLSTVEVLSTATIIEPADIVVDGAKEILFKWQHNIETGTEQTKFDIEKSADGVNFTALASQTTSAQSYMVAANAFTAGTVYWRVRTYNSDNAAGAWSNTAKIIVIAAPSAPVVSVDISPRPNIKWQATGQQAFEVEVGTVKSGLIFGVGKAYKLQAFLADGNHIARVRIQNQYGLWSEWGSASFTIANTPGGDITLAVVASHFAALGWTSTENYDLYYIYRDDVLTGKTTEKTFIDNTSVGNVKYRVRGVLANGNYGLSNVVSAQVTCETVMICNLESGLWLELEKTATSDRSSDAEESFQANYVYFAGSEYPSVEMAEFKSKKYEFEAAFSVKTGAIEFAKLIGKMVCIKDQWDNIVIGVLTGFSKSSTRFYQSFSCEISQVAYSEVVSYD